MNRSVILALAAILGLAAAPALAADPQPGSPPATPSDPPRHTTSSRLDPNEVVCKRQTDTGSRLGGAKICHTRQEWADIATQSRDNMDRAQERSYTNGPH